MRATKTVLCRIVALLVISPQPALNQNQTLKQKQALLQLILIDEVVGLAFLLLKIRKINANTPIDRRYFFKTSPALLES